MPSLIVPVVRGDGIRLRPFTSTDLATVMTAVVDPLIDWIPAVAPEATQAAARDYIDRQQERARDGAGFSFAIADADTDEAMGQIGVWLTDARNGLIRIGYWVSTEHRGKRVASRALRVATQFALQVDGVVRIEMDIEPWNTRSRRAALGVGYRCEGLSRGAIRIEGVPRDVFRYARLASEPDGDPSATADMVIADGTDEDAAELLVLQRCCWVSEAIANDTLDIPPLHESLDDVASWIRSWTVLTMRDGPRLVAAVRGRLIGETWEIGRLMVAPDLAGLGIGRRLLAQIERLAPTEAMTFELFTGARSGRNIDLYERSGYRVVDSSAVPPGHISGAVVLRKPVQR
ncbi:GNAT family N-acetyltransferase [Williamsia phyllosphaerae]|uniref:N-acetyltransferase domain-containing protein n=1 Tax=Williamsia phyllosphaerae TaxID=885042 RepID=A0ABQ1UFW5_9NOCA|nr:GNAT family N-acetyltransferase [Williamsia phyllosphaerae]GGF15824.1 hypothetical protein GCM10007298_09810 [Williamsia phyllosphaerae]